MTEAPIITPTDGSSTISAVLSTASVEVLKEEEAYSFLSLVSDCGGVLGDVAVVIILAVGSPIDPFEERMTRFCNDYLKNH